MDITDPNYSVKEFKTIKEVYAALLKIAENQSLPVNQSRGFPPLLEGSFEVTQGVGFSTHYTSNCWYIIKNIIGTGITVEVANDKNNWIPSVLIDMSNDMSVLKMTKNGLYKMKYPICLNDIRFNCEIGSSASVYFMSVFSPTYL